MCVGSCGHVALYVHAGTCRCGVQQREVGGGQRCALLPVLLPRVWSAETPTPLPRVWGDHVQAVLSLPHSPRCRWAGREVMGLCAVCPVSLYYPPHSSLSHPSLPRPFPIPPHPFPVHSCLSETQVGRVSPGFPSILFLSEEEVNVLQTTPLV